MNLGWVSPAVQIAVLYLVIYAILRSAKGSRFGQALLGIGILATLLIAFTYLVHLEVLAYIVKMLLAYIAVSTVVIFQPEIRRMLSAVGAFGYLEKPRYDPSGAATPELMVDIILELARERMGALIAFERGISLRGYENSGVMTDAVASRELVRTVFTPPLPLHDGGVIVRNGRIAAAHCVFPVSNNPDLIVSGMRHRAAVGMSEETDALVVVVSEETGAVSVAHNGKLFRYGTDCAHSCLLRWVTKAMRARETRQTLVDTAMRPVHRLLFGAKRKGVTK